MASVAAVVVVSAAAVVVVSAAAVVVVSADSPPESSLLHAAAISESANSRINPLANLFECIRIRPFLSIPPNGSPYGDQIR
jgi:hypothetical protein